MKVLVAYEFHNYNTGHCYVDYVARNLMSEDNGYTKIPLYKEVKAERRNNRKTKIFDFVVNHKTDCYQALKICNTHKGFNTKEGSRLVELARKEIGYSINTWDGDIYNVLWNVYKSITI